MSSNPTGLTETQMAYNVAQSDVFHLAAYGHHRYHPSGEALTDEGKRQQRDYNDRIRAAREELEAALLRLIAEHAETCGSPFVSADHLRTLADDPGLLSLLAVRPDERAEALGITPPAVVAAPAVCPGCQHTQHDPGTECEHRVEHDGGRRMHLCLCLNQPNADRSCPTQMNCQGGPLGYSDVYYLQRGHSLQGVHGERITPAVLTELPASMERDQLRATVARIARMVDAWEQRLPETIRTATAVDAIRQTLPTTLPPAPAPDPEPTLLWWALDDVLYGDDDTTTVLLSDTRGRPYWLEMQPDRAAALRQNLAGPDAEPATAAEPVVAYRSPGGSLYCVDCCHGNGMFAPLTSDDLPNGGLCDDCGTDVLIERNQPVRTDGMDT